jgi:hypothetical protein
MKYTTAIVIAATTATSAFASGLIIEDGNASADFGTDGQINWLVDGTNQLFAQEFWYRVGGANDETNINTLDNIGTQLSDTNPFTDDRADAIAQLWSDGRLEFETLFTLRGGLPGSGESALAEQITITNTSTASVSFSFFQVVDFDLGGDFGDDMGMIVDGNIAQQSDSGSTTLSETVATPFPTAFQMGDSTLIRGLFGNGVADNLDGTDSWTGDVAWAFQWDITLEAGESFLISKNKAIVPAPGTFAFLGLAGLTAARRRRS